MLCLAAVTSAQVESYFSAEIVHGQTIVSFTEQVNMMGVYNVSKTEPFETVFSE